MKSKFNFIQIITLFVLILYQFQQNIVLKKLIFCSSQPMATKQLN